MICSCINCQVGLDQHSLLEQLVSILDDALLPLLEELQIVDYLVLASPETASGQRKAQPARNSVFFGL